jgi:hypothetical protein
MLETQTEVGKGLDLLCHQAQATEHRGSSLWGRQEISSDRFLESL